MVAVVDNVGAVQACKVLSFGNRFLADTTVVVHCAFSDKMDDVEWVNRFGFVVYMDGIVCGAWFKEGEPTSKVSSYIITLDVSPPKVRYDSSVCNGELRVYTAVRHSSKDNGS